MWKLLIAALVVGIAYVSKPNEPEFKNDIENQIVEKMKLKESDNLLGNLFVSKLVKGVFWNVVNVQFSDYLVCSSFKVSMGSKDIIYLGVFGQIIPVSGSSALDEITESIDK